MLGICLPSRTKTGASATRLERSEMADADVVVLRSKKAKGSKAPKGTKGTKRAKAAKSGKRRAPLREIPFKVTNPERIPAQRYYDQEFYDLEVKYLWPKVWQMAARLEEIPEVGDWVEYENLGKSAIIVRTKNGVKAFANSCRH